MTEAEKGTKRKLEKASVSPPPLKRKTAQSTITKSTIASFFTPTSQKPAKAPEKIRWHERSQNDDSPNTLLVGKYDPGREETPAVKRRKIAAFDFDSTLIDTISKKKFSDDHQDWKWWHASVPNTLKKLYNDESYRVVVVSNQAGIALKPDPKKPTAHKNRLAIFKTKVSAVFDQLDLPISIYAATEKDIFRKPRTGMWKELIKDYDLDAEDEVDVEQSFFVGDAGGRVAGSGGPKDFSCSDRNFADNIGIKFLTPEEYFLKQKPRPFERSLDPTKYIGREEEAMLNTTPLFSRSNEQDIVLFVGSPGSGKSTFYAKNLKPLDYERVNQDLLKTRDKCFKVAKEYLSEGKSVAVDNTNADQEVRSKWVAIAKEYKVPIRCVFFKAEATLCEHNNVVRALNQDMNPEKRELLPAMAFRGFASRFRKPTIDEGFQDVVEVDFKFTGTNEERAIWSRHWN